MRFLLVDELHELTPGKSAVGTHFVSPDADYFADHFPGFPVVPGVLLTEMLGQTAGKALEAENPGRGKAMLVQIQSARFQDWVRPGTTVRLFASVRSSRPQFATASCRAEVDGKPVCTAELLFAFLPPDQLGPDYRDSVLDAYLARHPVNPPEPDNPPSSTA